MQAGDREPFGSREHLAGAGSRIVQDAPAPASSSTLTVQRSMRSSHDLVAS